MDEAGEARAALDRFTRIYGQTAPPVDVNELAESLCRLRVRLADDLSRVPGAPAGVALSGMLLPGRMEVWVNRSETPARRRFSVAHEVGHFLLHAAADAEQAVYCRAGDVRPDPEDPARTREREANRFAAALLMPEALVANAVERLGAVPDALARVFAVSELAMAFRLVNLGYLRALPADLQATWQSWRG
jgi:hypothetical protein